MKDVPCPQYRQVAICRSPPFVQIDPESARVRANVDDEESPVNTAEQFSSQSRTLFPQNPSQLEEHQEPDTDDFEDL